MNMDGQDMRGTVPTKKIRGMEEEQPVKNIKNL